MGEPAARAVANCAPPSGRVCGFSVMWRRQFCSTRAPLALHTLLDLPTGTPPWAMREGFRRAALATHPDRNPSDPAAAERMKALQAAWEAYRRSASLGRTAQQHEASGFTEFGVGCSFSDSVRGQRSILRPLGCSLPAPCHFHLPSDLTQRLHDRPLSPQPEEGARRRALTEQAARGVMNPRSLPDAPDTGTNATS